MADLDVLILTFNEERHIARAIASVGSVARKIFVIDSYSTDRTVEIATTMGATVLQHPFANQAKQFKWGLDHAPLAATWVMRLDADEIVEPDLAEEISRRLPALETDVVGVNLKRKHIFLGRWIRHGGRYPLVLLRIWRRGKGCIEDRWMDEHVFIWGGRTVTFDGGFADHNLNDLTFFTHKHNHYATREAIDVIAGRRGLFTKDFQLLAHATSKQASAKRWLKQHLYNRIPYQCSSFAYFFFRYVVQLGFLDGREGLVYHFLQGLWYRFLVGAKVKEYEAALDAATGLMTERERLARLTGHSLDD